MTLCSGISSCCPPLFNPILNVPAGTKAIPGGGSFECALATADADAEATATALWAGSAAEFEAAGSALAKGLPDVSGFGVGGVDVQANQQAVTENAPNAEIT